MASVNKVILIGNLGRDPQLQHTRQGGVAFCTLSLATNQRRKNPETGEFKENTQWHLVRCWRAQAENCCNYLKKGSPVYVEGELDHREWTDDEGAKHHFTEVKAREIQFLGRGNGGHGGADIPPPPDDDIPF
jgi:single-strand DNA-binding protein